MKQKLLIIFPLVGLLSGCETLQNPQQRQQAIARQKATDRMVVEILHRLQDKVESVEMENGRLAEEMQQLRSEVRSLSNQMGQLGSGMQSLESRRARDRREVVNQVSSLIKKQGAAISGNSSGREHVVESGHTLSAIAVAYGTTVSAIEKANNLASDRIYVGQKLFIPE